MQLYSIIGVINIDLQEDLFIRYKAALQEKECYSGIAEYLR